MQILKGNMNYLDDCVEALQESDLGRYYFILRETFHGFPYLHLIATKASKRGSGVGTQLLSYLERIVNSSKIFLVVADFNPEGKRFYERNGYMQVGRIESLY